MGNRCYHLMGDRWCSRWVRPRRAAKCDSRVHRASRGLARSLSQVPSSNAAVACSVTTNGPRPDWAPVLGGRREVHGGKMDGVWFLWIARPGDERQTDTSPRSPPEGWMY